MIDVPHRPPPPVMAGLDPAIPTGTGLRIAQLTAGTAGVGMAGSDPRVKRPGTAMTGRRRRRVDLSGDWYYCAGMRAARAGSICSQTLAPVSCVSIGGAEARRRRDEFSGWTT